MEQGQEKNTEGQESIGLPVREAKGPLRQVIGYHNGEGILPESVQCQAVEEQQKWYVPEVLLSIRKENTYDRKYEPHFITQKW